MYQMILGELDEIDEMQEVNFGTMGSYNSLILHSNFKQMQSKQLTSPKKEQPNKNARRF